MRNGVCFAAASWLSHDLYFVRVDVLEIAPGLWRWTARHAEWHPGEWGAEVASFAVDASGSVNGPENATRTGSRTGAPCRLAASRATVTS